MARDDTPLIRRLASEFQGTITGRARRDACELITQSSQVNFWFHPNLDPSVRIDVNKRSTPTGTAPKVWQVLSQIADRADAVIFPVANILVMGPESWVNAFALQTLRANPSPRIDVAWPILTTPHRAHQIILGKINEPRRLPSTIPQTKVPLRHDLWPAVQWIGIESHVALAVVSPQVDVPINLGDVPEETLEQVACDYPVGTWLNAAIEVDRGTAKSRVTDSRVRVTTSVAGHLAIRSAWIEATSEPPEASKISRRNGSRAGKQTVKDSARFSLRVRARLGEILTQLAVQRGVTLHWNPQLDQTIRDQIIDLSAKDATLDELAKIIAGKADLEISLGPEVWSIDPPGA